MRVILPLLLSLSLGAGGCAAPRWVTAPAPGTPQFREAIPAGQLVIHADFALPPGHRMVTELVSERQLICDRLNLPAGGEPIHVYLFGNEAAYRAHVLARYPGFPERRAIFVETDVELAVYAHWSDHVADDLRHEAAHGYLHSTVPNLPLWLDEGLAEYFEVGRGRRGVNQPHVDLLLARQATGGWRPDLPRLERLTTAAEMTQLDYAEAWLWAHFLLEGGDGKPSAELSELLGALPRASRPRR